MSVDGENAMPDVQNVADDVQSTSLNALQPPEPAPTATNDSTMPPGPSSAQPPEKPPVSKAIPAADMNAFDSTRPLNVTDALGYLDCVKQQFQNQTDVYNRFLDIMKDFKSQQIDTPGVIERVSNLFRGYPNLIQGFNTFLPAGYRIECSTDDANTNLITVTTPSGTKIQELERAVVYRELVRDHPDVVANTSKGDIERALMYVQSVKTRYANEPERYKAFLEILSPGDFEGEDVIARVKSLFQDDTDLMKGFYHFLPDRDTQERMAAHLDEIANGPVAASETKATKRKGGDAAAKGAAGATVPAKRKRKPAERDKAEPDREKHKEIAPKPGPSKVRERAKQQHITSEAPSPSLSQMHSIPASPRRGHAQPSTHHNIPTSHAREQPMHGVVPPHSQVVPQRGDDQQFFDKVKRALSDRETYNEFLKVVNLFTQDIIDTARLIKEARTYLGETELMAQFKDILGWDERRERYAGAEDVWTRPTGVLDRPSRNQLNLRYGSYRKLPASEAHVTCSGRDEMCKSVLNDEWVAQPSFASEDAGFLAHKKNAYEEALHRSEEERHEYDFHIEAIQRTIQLLEPYNAKINLLTPEEKATYKFKPNLSGAGKSIHQRVIKKVYGREAGMEVYQAMQEIPVIAIPLVVARLKQKLDEWKRAQREWNKVWKEVDARNYYKSLDHQGVSFKAADKKALTTKSFVSQIEAARDEQMAQRAALIDPLFSRTRPRHQLEYTIDDVAVLQDIVKLTCSFLDRTQGQINVGDRRKIETFLRSFIPLFFIIDPVVFNSSTLPQEVAEPQPGDTDVIMDTDDAASKAARAVKNNGSDLRKRLLKNEQAKSSRRTRAQDGVSPSSSAAASPHLSEAMLVDSDVPPAANGETLSAPPSPTDSKSNRKGTFFTNTHFYVFIRLLEVLYSRLHLFKELTAALATDDSHKPNPVANHLGLTDNIYQPPVDAAHYYDLLLVSCEKLFDNQLDQHTFEEQLRFMFGTQHAYKMFTVDKVIGSILKQIQHILSDPKSQDLYDLLKRERELTNPTSQDLINMRKNTEKVIGPDENLFRMVWFPDSKTVTIQLLGKDDSNFDDSEVVTGRWQAYVDSFVSPGETSHLSRPLTRKPYLQRTLDSTAVDSETQPDVHGEGALGLRICVRTYRLFYVAGSEDVLWRHVPSEQAAEAARRLEAHNARRKAWLEKFLDREKDKDKDKEAPTPKESSSTPKSAPAPAPEVKSPPVEPQPQPTPAAAPSTAPTPAS